MGVREGTVHVRTVAGYPRAGLRALACAQEAVRHGGGCSREGRAECSGLGKGHPQVLISGAEEGRSRGIKASEDQREKHLRVTKRVREQMQSEAGGLLHAAGIVRGQEAGGGCTA